MNLLSKSIDKFGLTSTIILSIALLFGVLFIIFALFSIPESFFHLIGLISFNLGAILINILIFAFVAALIGVSLFLLFS